MRLLLSVCAPIIEPPVDENSEQFNLNLDEFNAQYAESLMKYGKPINVYELTGYEGATHLHNAVVTVVVENARIKYLCQWELHSRKGRRVLVQLNVWQDPTWQGFARRMIDWFVDRFSCLELSDTQYPRGALMYQKYIRDNVQRRYIYLKNNDVVTRIKTEDQFVQMIDKIWSKNESHKNVRVLISDKEL